MSVKTIGVVGGGTVGRATARAFVEHVEEVRVYDVVTERCTHHLPAVLDCHIVFVALPTPGKPDGGLDVSYIDKFFDAVKNNWRGLYQSSNFVLKSTVPVGTTRRLVKEYGLTNIVHSPEFLTARTSLIDAQMPSRNIIGIPHKIEKPNQCAELLNQLYTNRFPGVWTYGMESDESELVKLACNSFFAVKIAYFNELHAYATAIGVNWERLLEGILSDGRIAHSHTKVPGPDGKFGWGGSCLPKDISELVNAMYDHPRRDIHPWVCNAAMTRNKEIDRERKS